LEHALSSILKTGSVDIIVDLGNVDYVSSAGWGIFISEIKGIREKGGDLKLVRMIPEVYEVFELLEFHYILKAFDTLEEAIKDFERTRPKSGVGKTIEVTTGPQPAVSEIKEPVDTQKRAVPEIPTGETIEEKIQIIAAEMPEAGTIQIARQLNSARFGFQRVGWFRLRKLLKKLNLDSKQKRIVHSRTSAKKAD